MSAAISTFIPWTDRGDCPECGAERAILSPDGRGRVCWSCTDGRRCWDGRQTAALTTQPDPAGLAGAHNEPLSSHDRRRENVRKRKDRELRATYLGRLLELIEKHAEPADAEHAGRAYLEARNLDPAAAAAAGVLYLSPRAAGLVKRIMHDEHGAAALNKAEEGGTGWNGLASYVERAGGAVSWPEYQPDQPDDPDGLTRTGRGLRLLKPDPHGPKALAVGGRGIFGVGRLGVPSTVTADADLVLVEPGAWADALALAAAMPDATVITGPPSLKLRRCLAAELTSGRDRRGWTGRLVIATDADTAGDKYAHRWRLDLGRAVCRMRPPEQHNDWAAALAAGEAIPALEAPRGADECISMALPQDSLKAAEFWPLEEVWRQNLDLERDCPDCGVTVIGADGGAAAGRCWGWACGRCAPRKMAGLELALRELVAGKLPGARSARPPELRAKRLPEDGKARKLALQLLKRAGLQWLELRLWDGPAVTLVLGGTDGQKLDAADPQALVAALLAGADPRAVARGTLRVNGSRGDDGPGPALNARIAALCGRKKQDKPEPREDTDAPEALLVLGGVDRAAAALARYGVALVLDIDNPVHEPRCGLGEWAPAALASRLAAEREDRRDTKVFKRDEQLAAELKEGRERLCSELDTLRQHARMAWESGCRGTPAGLLDLRDIRRPAAAERRRA